MSSDTVFFFRPSLSSRLVQGRHGEGLVYSVTTDTGVFNTGLNLNMCGMLAVLGPDVMTDAVRTLSLRFNTYNGQCDGLFSSVDITARFTLGERTGGRLPLRAFFSRAPVSSSLVVCRTLRPPAPPRRCKTITQSYGCLTIYDLRRTAGVGLTGRGRRFCN